MPFNRIPEWMRLPPAVPPVPPEPADARPVDEEWRVVWDNQIRNAAAREQAVQDRIFPPIRFHPNGGLGEAFAVLGDQPMITPGKRGEELFQLILSGIREVFEVDAAIAGGAVRDLAAGYESTSKDVDVWIPMKLGDFQQRVSELGWQGGFNPQAVKQYKNTKGDECPVKTVIGRASSRVQGMLIDLIFLEKELSPEDVKLFPVHAQRCVWTLSGGKAVSPEAKADIEAKAFTIDPTITDKERIKGLIAKVKEWQQRACYKDWKLVEPDVKEWWEAKEEMEVDKKEGEKDMIKFYYDLARYGAANVQAN